MKLQLALDRMSIDEAIAMVSEVEDHIDWIEVGTSLIKEFGVKSIRAISDQFPTKTIVADIKVNDNAAYEANLCFSAGADVLTVMGSAPASTIETCLEVAKTSGKDVMIDLLNLTSSQKEELLTYKEAIFCEHVSKDEQEKNGEVNHFTSIHLLDGRRLAVAGGITENSFEALKEIQPEVVIIGSAITKAREPEKAAGNIRKISQQEEVLHESNEYDSY
ncbi:MAG: 3-hexulose-6-phosphate synthase [Anaerobacillus sp.]